MWFCFVGRSIATTMNVLTEDGPLRMPLLRVSEIPTLSRSVSRATRFRRRAT